jgi:hypothetical protein
MEICKKIESARQFPVRKTFSKPSLPSQGRNVFHGSSGTQTFWGRNGFQVLDAFGGIIRKQKMEPGNHAK